MFIQEVVPCHRRPDRAAYRFPLKDVTQKSEDTIARTTAFSSRGIGCRIDPEACKKVRTPVSSIRWGDRLKGNCTRCAIARLSSNYR
ncbi:hypothetical protein QUA63_04370 [Microcoleus sp. M2_D2]